MFAPIPDVPRAGVSVRQASKRPLRLGRGRALLIARGLGETPSGEVRSRSRRDSALGSRCGCTLTATLPDSAGTRSRGTVAQAHRIGIAEAGTGGRMMITQRFATEATAAPGEARLVVVRTALLMFIAAAVIQN